MVKINTIDAITQAKLAVLESMGLFIIPIIGMHIAARSYHLQGKTHFLDEYSQSVQNCVSRNLGLDNPGF